MLISGLYKYTVPFSSREPYSARTVQREHPKPAMSVRVGLITPCWICIYTNCSLSVLTTACPLHVTICNHNYKVSIDYARTLKDTRLRMPQIHVLDCKNCDSAMNVPHDNRGQVFCFYPKSPILIFRPYNVLFEIWPFFLFESSEQINHYHGGSKISSL